MSKVNTSMNEPKTPLSLVKNTSKVSSSVTLDGGWRRISIRKWYVHAESE